VHIVPVSIENLRMWLKVPEGAYSDWKDFKRNVVLPAVNEINEHGEDGGFFVAYEGLREGKSFAQVKFTLTKTAARDDRDVILQDKARRARSQKGGGHGREYAPTDPVWDKLREIAPGWDCEALLARFRQWSDGKPAPKNPHGAFLAWAKRFTKGRRPS
jgi:hypothetical protein